MSAHTPSSTGQTHSLWMKTAEMPQPGKLEKDLRADVCVVGAGIAGLTTAYLLARQKKSVVVLESLTIGGGETGRTTAHLSFALDDRYYNLERLHGERGAQLAAESHRAAVAKIEAIIAKEKIDCDFQRLDGYLFVPPGESVEQLHKELAAARRAGLTDVEMVDRAPLNSFDTGPALRFPQQAQFHPLKYLAGLAKAIARDGGQIFAGTHANGFAGGAPGRVQTDRGPVVTAHHLVVATNSPVNDMVTMHTKQAAYRTYAIGIRVHKDTVPVALYWDTPDPYHYVRVQSLDKEFDILVVGGEDHKTGQEDNHTYAARFTRLEAWARERFPAGQVEFRWSGQVIEPMDGLAYIGRNPQDKGNVYIVTADSGHGLTHGTIAGMLLSDLIQGRENPWTTLYDPARINLRASKEFIKENLNVAAEYGKWLTGGEVSDVEEIPRGEGAIVRQGTSKLAVYRDDAGALHERSAVCRHLGCIVAWNNVEKTWDCPCHGSRWDKEGAVLNGPAIGDMPHEIEQAHSH